MCWALGECMDGETYFVILVAKLYILLNAVLWCSFHFHVFFSFSFENLCTVQQEMSDEVVAVVGVRAQ